MGELVLPKKFVSLKELSSAKNIPMWLVYELSRSQKLPVRCIDGKPLIPYQVDLEEFEKLESTAVPSQNRSLKTSKKLSPLGHRKKEKEPLWLK